MGRGIGIIVLGVVLIGAGFALRPASDAWSPAPRQDGRALLFDEHFTIVPDPIYTEAENASMAEKIDEINFLSPQKLGEIPNLFTFNRRVGVGETAPDFRLVRTDGQELALSDLRGKVAVFMFAAMTCPPAREQVPRFEALQQKYDEEDVVFFLVYSRERHPGETGYPDFEYASSDAEKVALARQLDELTTLPIAVDGIDEHVLGLYGEVPNAAYVIDPQGRIVFRSTWADSRKIERVVDTLLDHQRGGLPSVAAGAR